MTKLLDNSMNTEALSNTDSWWGTIDEMRKKITDYNHAKGLKTIMGGAWTYDKLVQNARKKGYTNAESISVEQLIQIADSVNHRLSQADQEELQKCKDSPVYFYNKYVRKEGQKELTEAEYKDFLKQVEYHRNMPLKLRSHYKDRPLTPDQCYEKLPDFLKNGG